MFARGTRTSDATLLHSDVLSQRLMDKRDSSNEFRIFLLCSSHVFILHRSNSPLMDGPLVRTGSHCFCHCIGLRKTCKITLLLRKY